MQFMVLKLDIASKDILRSCLEQKYPYKEPLIGKNQFNLTHFQININIEISGISLKLIISLSKQFSSEN